jgi:hypothetical protein
MMAWALLVWVPLVFLGVGYAFRTFLSRGPLHLYVQPYSKHAAGDVTFIGGVNWAGSGAGIRYTTPLARVTVRAQEIQLGPSVRLLAALMPTFIIPTSQVEAKSVVARGTRPERAIITTPHGGVEFLGPSASAFAEALRPQD